MSWIVLRWAAALGIVLAFAGWTPSPVHAQVITWEIQATPVFEGEWVASDPALLRTPSGYRMFYTCFVIDPAGFTPETTRAAICEARSRDGLTWTNTPGRDRTQGLILRGREGEWDTHLEAAFAVEWQGRTLLYYSGYEHEGDPAMGFPASLAVAESVDGGPFTRLNDGEPVLAPSPGGRDNEAVYSPAIVEYDGALVMVYAGHCYTRCDIDWGVSLLAATSDDGVNWTKREDPVLRRDVPGVPWTSEGVAEPALVEDSDGTWLLFFTGVREDLRQIGIARGGSPFGPWEVESEPIIAPGPAGAFNAAGALAPFVFIEDDRLRMWYLGVADPEDFAIGYAEGVAST